METALDIRGVHAAAVERVRAREWKVPDYRREAVTAMLDGRSPQRLPSMFGPRFRPPTSLGEWLDDMMTQRRSYALGLPETGVLFEIAEAARESTAAAARTVRTARRLTGMQQFIVYRILLDWRSATTYPPGEAMVAAVLAEWHARKLADEQPQEPVREARSWRR